MKLEFNKTMVDLNGDPIVDQEKNPLTMAKWLANQLAQQSSKGNAAQHYSWSMELWKSGAIEDIDKSSIQKLKAFVEQLEAPTLVVGQILAELDK